MFGLHVFLVEDVVLELADLLATPDEVEVLLGEPLELLGSSLLAPLPLHALQSLHKALHLVLGTGDPLDLLHLLQYALLLDLVQLFLGLRVDLPDAAFLLLSPGPVLAGTAFEVFLGCGLFLGGGVRLAFLCFEDDLVESVLDVAEGGVQLLLAHLI